MELNRSRRAGWRLWLLVGVMLVAGLWVWDSIARQFQAKDDRPHATTRVLKPAAPANLSAGEILGLAGVAWEAVQDYACQTTSTNRRKGSLDENVLSIHFKRPGMLKHVIVEGPNKGVVITRDSAGNVKARPGGALGILVVSVKPDDPRLHDGRGIPFYQTDWGSELARLREWRDQGASFERLADEKDQAGEYWRIRVSLPPRVEEIWFDAGTHLPRRFISIWEGELQRDVRYDDIAINTSPADDVFLIK